MVLTLVLAFVVSQILDSLLDDTAFLLNDHMFEKTSVQGEAYYHYKATHYQEGLSKVLGFFQTTIIYWVFISFFILGFTAFYRDKLKPVTTYFHAVDHKTQVPSLQNKDELSRACLGIHKQLMSHEKDRLQQKYLQGAFETNISTLLHGLKNPLAVISGNLEMLAYMEAKDPETFEDLIENTHYNLQRIQTYMTKLKNFEAMTSDDLYLESIMIEDLIKPLEESVKKTPSKVKCHWAIQNSHSPIPMDFFKMQEAISAVLENCLTYAQSEVIISGQVQGSHYIITLLDDGQGFSNEALKKATAPYYSDNPGPNNSGLGLYYANEIIKKHQGELQVFNHQKGAGIKIILSF
jgi:K+-sensing histidine kinase KdpD